MEPVDFEKVRTEAAVTALEQGLARAPDSWKYVTLNSKKYTREFNTMPQWAGSCWYYLRYIDPLNEKAAVDPA